MCEAVAGEKRGIMWEGVIYWAQAMSINVIC